MNSHLAQGEDNEREAKEREFIDLLKPALNKQKPTRTPKEYYKDHKEEIIDNVKKYRDENKEEIKQRKQTLMTCECGSEFRKADKCRHERSKKHLNFITK